MCTCEGVSSLVFEISHSLQQLLFRGEVVELPFCAGVSTVLGETWTKIHCRTGFYLFEGEVIKSEKGCNDSLWFK